LIQIRQWRRIYSVVEIIFANKIPQCMISGFRGGEEENCIPLGYDAACSGDFSPTFRDELSISSSGIKNPRESKRNFFLEGGSLNPEDGTDRFPETSVRSYHYLLRNDSEEHSSFF
jgi:hypothetical protein